MIRIRAAHKEQTIDGCKPFDQGLDPRIPAREGDREISNFNNGDMLMSQRLLKRNSWLPVPRSAELVVVDDKEIAEQRNPIS